MEQFPWEIQNSLHFNSWLEKALEAEREAVCSVLQKRHHDLLSELSRMQISSWPEEHVKGGTGASGVPVSTHASSLSQEGLPGEVHAGDDLQGGSPEVWDLTDESNSLQVQSKGGDAGDNGRKARRESDDSGKVQFQKHRKITTSLAFVNKSMPVMEDDPVSWRHRVSMVVTSPRFEAFFGVLIVLNILLMSVEAQYKGIKHGGMLGYEGYTAHSTWPNADVAIDVVEFLFGVTFTSELVLKIIGLSRNFVYDPWNWIDVFIVLTWLIDTINLATLPINPMGLRLVRLLRLLRLLRLVRSFNSFDPLFLMATAMKGSLTLLVWTVFVLVVVQMMIALCLQTMLEGFVLNEAEDEAKRMEVFKFYGTFARTMLTMFEMTLGNWMPPCRAIVENVTEWYMVVALAHKLVIGFSMVSVITGVFIQETFKVASSDDKIMMRHKERAIKTHTKKMRALFDAANGTDDGYLDMDEFTTIMDDPSVRTWLSAMELDVRDSKKLFRLIDDGDGQLSAEELVKGVALLKGTAKSFDVLSLMQETLEQRALLERINDRINCGLSRTIAMDRRPLS
mmetsp:Transcript_35268/g.97380  ORF Transcript_35268/g.97380 Transcript_35268/m.97380 type:complete len:565 (+) Transcript_35268:53-1747(+)